MKRGALVFVLASLVCASVYAVDSDAAGRQDLFDGKSLDGWTIVPEAAAQGDTWSVQGGVIHCNGTPNGYIKTKKTYEDYKLHFEWRWAAKPGNSGCLLHMSGPDKVWPKSIEAQLMNGNAGDFYVIDGTMIKEHEGKPGRRIQKKEASSEKPAGEWNAMDVVCDEDRIEVRVNGVLQNVGTEASVDDGHICLQSEGAPIEFRNVYLVEMGDDDD